MIPGTFSANKLIFKNINRDAATEGLFLIPFKELEGVLWLEPTRRDWRTTRLLWSARF
jgi:hypothetical protein